MYKLFGAGRLYLIQKLFTKRMRQFTMLAVYIQFKNKPKQTKEKLDTAQKLAQTHKDALVTRLNAQQTRPLAFLM